MAHYLVTIERTIIQWIDVEVDADDKVDARVLALAEAKDASEADWESIPETADDHEVTETQYAGD